MDVRRRTGQESATAGLMVVRHPPKAALRSLSITCETATGSQFNLASTT